MAFKTSARARELTQRHDLKVFPALVVDNQVRAVGSPSAEHAHRILREIIPDDP